jgi:hypothetical protein
MLPKRARVARTAAVTTMRVANGAAAFAGLKVIRGNILGEEWFRKVSYFARLVDRVANVEGDVAVCRVGVGKTLAVLASLVRTTDTNRLTWGFDSWSSGADAPPAAADGDAFRLTPTVAEVRLRLRQMGFDGLGPVRLVDGALATTLDRAPNLALVDLDLLGLDDYILCLEKLWPKVQPGGIVSFGNFAPGEALERFLPTVRPSSATVERDAAWHGRAFIVKLR